MFDVVAHKWLKLPYTLHVRHNRRPKDAHATVLFIHGIGNTGDAWDEVIKRLPDDVRIITIDLLGFGQSPKPRWPIYSARMQADSVLATMVKLRIVGKLIVVGHSLGSLVAVEMARRYPLLIDSMILCSPPFYDTDEKERTLLPRTDRALRQIYRSVQKHPEEFVRLSAFAMKYNLVNKSFSVTDTSVDGYMTVLESMIINQTSLQDAQKISVPTQIIRGTLDPFVVKSNIKSLTKTNPNISATFVVAGHEVRGLFVLAAAKAIKSRLKSAPKSGKNK